MPLIFIGFGDFEDYRLNELPKEALERLAVRYPLMVAEDSSPEYDEVIITIAIHAELARRLAGGVQEQHTPSRRELAQMIIKRGFQQASKQHHPDGPGHHDAQVRLANVRDELIENCATMPRDRPTDAIIIPASPQEKEPRPRETTPNSWDDGAPF